MICPRCGKEIPDTETLCPFCMQEINRNMEFNDFKEDGFVQIRPKDDSVSTGPENYKPKYFDISEYNIFAIAIIFVLCVSLFTIFSLRFVQKRNKLFIPKYVSTQPTTETTEPTTETVNTVKKFSVKDLIGSWKLEGDEDTDYSAIPYYVFKGKDSLAEYYGSIVVKGTFVDISDGDNKGIYLSIDSNLKGAYDYKIVGNKKDGNTLILTNRTNGGVYHFVKATAKMKKLEVIPKHKLDKGIIGSWYTEDKKKAYKFTSKGTLKRITGNTTTYGVWTVAKKKEITIKYMKNEIKTVIVPYNIVKKDKQLMVNGTLYYKAKK